MQLHVRGNETHVVECEESESIAQIKVRFAHLYSVQYSILILLQSYE